MKHFKHFPIIKMILFYSCFASYDLLNIYFAGPLTDPVLAFDVLIITIVRIYT